MRKYFCDRCGGEGAEHKALYLEKAVMVKRVGPDVSSPRWYDLCDPCRVAILQLLEEIQIVETKSAEYR